MYNNRLQPCLIDVNSSNVSLQTCNDSTPGGNVLDFWMGYNAGTSNNGNVANWNATGAQSFIRTYGYDSLNRLSTLADSATAQPCKGVSWTYDPWANRTDQSVTAGSCGTFHSSVGTNNRLGSPYQYDAAGNMTYDGTHSYTYDAENRLTQVDGGATAAYIYDADGRRMQKAAGGSTTNYIYDLAGNVAAEFSCATCWNVGYIYLDGSLLAQYFNNTTYFVHKDHLGSTRLVTALDQSVYDSMDYLPFGEQIAGSSATSHKFTSKERDSESGLDNFGARYDSSSLGRFMSPDPLGGHISNPQSLNRYTYVLNNPLRFVDPFGLEGQDSFRACISTEGPYCANFVTPPDLGNGLPGGAPAGLDLPQSQPAPPAPELPSSASSPPSGNPGAGTASTSPGLDAAQLGLGLLGVVPGIGTGANLINAGISLYRGQYGQAALNAAFAIPFVGTFGRAAQLGEGALEAAKGVEGIYEFVGNTGKIYVGQSGNIGLRLAQHLKSGALLEEGISSIRFTEVSGGRLIREIAEQFRINELGGIRGGNLQNVRNAIGLARDYLMVPLIK